MFLVNKWPHFHSVYSGGVCKWTSVALSYKEHRQHFFQAKGFFKLATQNPLYFGLGFIGNFRNGQVYGHFWAGMVHGVDYHGGYLHGKADKFGLITGNDIAYIYPDGETAFKVDCLVYGNF